MSGHQAALPATNLDALDLLKNNWLKILRLASSFWFGHQLG
jgi:hypothetical protein